MEKETTTIGTFADTFQASLARNALEALGIPCWLDGEAAADLMHMGSGVVVKLLVAKEDEAEAQRLLEELRQQSEKDAEDAIAEGEPPESDIQAAFSEHPIDAAMLAPTRQEPAVPVSEREQLVDRAVRSAILGLIFPPLIFLSVYFLFLAYGTEEPLEPPVRRRLVVASVFVLPYAIVLLGFAMVFCIAVR